MAVDVLVDVIGGTVAVLGRLLVAVNVVPVVTVEVLVDAIGEIVATTVGACPEQKGYNHRKKCHFTPIRYSQIK